MANKSLLATWTGTALTCLGGLASALAVLYPQNRLLFVVLAIVFFLGALASFVALLVEVLRKPGRRWRLRMPWETVGLPLKGADQAPIKQTLPGLQVAASIDPLTHSYSNEWPEVMVYAGQLGRSFAVLRVRNEGDNNLEQVVARCFTSGGDTEIPCFWSIEPGGRFVSGETIAADLRVWQERLLVFAQFFESDRLWTKLPANQEELFFIPPHTPGARDGSCFRSRAKEHLDLGGKVEISVHFRCHGGLKLERRFLLSYDFEGPSIERLPDSTPSTDPAPSKPYE